MSVVPSYHVISDIILARLVISAEIGNPASASHPPQPCREQEYSPQCTVAKAKGKN